MYQYCLKALNFCFIWSNFCLQDTIEQQAEKTCMGHTWPWSSAQHTHLCRMIKACDTCIRHQWILGCLNRHRRMSSCACCRSHIIKKQLFYFSLTDSKERLQDHPKSEITRINLNHSNLCVQNAGSLCRQNHCSAAAVGQIKWSVFSVEFYEQFISFI